VDLYSFVSGIIGDITMDDLDGSEEWGMPVPDVPKKV